MAAFGYETTGKEVVKRFAARVSGKTIVITGASADGLGAQTAIDLADAHPAAIVLLGRSLQKVRPVIDQIRAISPSTNAAFVAVELDKLASIRSAAEQVANQIPQLDILINNAGIMAVPYSKTELGLESQLATNHIGHFYLTNLLMPKILAAGQGARIVNVSSHGYQLSTFRFDDPNFSDGAAYHRFAGYGQSKTANILFTTSLASKLASKGIFSYTLHPGIIHDTSLSNHLEMSDFQHLDAVAKQYAGESPDMKENPKTLEQGVATTIVAAIDPSLDKHSGAYLLNCTPSPVREYATSAENAEKLWGWSEEIVGEKFEI